MEKQGFKNQKGSKETVKGSEFKRPPKVIRFISTEELEKLAKGQ